MIGNVASRSHPGKRRNKNEDALLVKECGDALLLIVADGVGGERGGEVASHEAVRIIAEHLEGQPHLPDPAASLTAGIEAANGTILARGTAERRLRGMATTVVAAVAVSDAVWIANVGDSRAYLAGEHTIHQITQDHSLVAERLVEGSMTEEEARTSGARHIITRSIGSMPEVEVDLFGPLQLLAGTTLLLCSDGLTDAVDDAALHEILLASALDQAADSLIDAANANGGPDNISVILYRSQ